MRRSQFAWRRTARRNGWMRALLGILALGSGMAGLWALIAPRSFYSSFPGLGLAWVHAQPPYNAHLVRDYGGLSSALAILFVWAAISVDKRLIRAVSCAWLVSALPHLVFHLGRAEPSGLSGLIETIALAAGVVIPIVLLVLARGRARTGI